METSEKRTGRIAGLNSISSQSAGGYGYINVRQRTGERLHGGNQGWYLAGADVTKLQKQGIKSQWQLCRRDENYRIASLGCGVIAMTNLELYLRMRFCNSAENKAGEIDQSEYETYVSRKWQGTYRIGKSYFNYLTGLYPWKMEEGLRRFLTENHLDRQNVKWAPYAFKPQKSQKELTLALIREMLEADYPVVCSYHTFQPKKNGLILYSKAEDALKGGTPGSGDDVINSHYMTIIGLWREKDLYLLQAESWGKIYFFCYDKYAERLNYFTNVLAIR